MLSYYAGREAHFKVNLCLISNPKIVELPVEFILHPTYQISSGVTTSCRFYVNLME